MTLANMRAQGVCSLWVVCDLSHHDAALNVDRFGDEVPVPAFGPSLQVVWHQRRVCTAELAGAAHERKPDRSTMELSGGLEDEWLVVLKAPQ